MKKLIFALASVFTASALTGCGNDPEDVALGMVKAIVNGDAEKAASYCSPEEKTHCNIKDVRNTKSGRRSTRITARWAARLSTRSW